jgi:hypothetical protein
MLADFRTVESLEIANEMLKYHHDCIDELETMILNLRGRVNTLEEKVATLSTRKAKNT